MVPFLMVVHVFVCLVLILVILLQAGRGGGFSDMMGGSQPQSIFGTQTNNFMTRATEVCAVVFVITSLSLAVISTQRGKSLVEKEMFMKSLKKNLPPMPAPSESKTPELSPATAPVSEAVPAAPVSSSSVPPKEADAR